MQNTNSIMNEIGYLRLCRDLVVTGQIEEDKKVKAQTASQHEMRQGLHANTSSTIASPTAKIGNYNASSLDAHKLLSPKMSEVNWPSLSCFH